MRTLRKILLVSSLSLFAPLAASAQSVSDVQDLSPEDRRAYMESMSEDERTAMREQWRSEYESLSDEEKQAMRDKRAKTRGDRGKGRDREAMRERWESMSEDERTAAREKHKQRKGPRGERRKGKDKGAGQQDEQPES